MSGRDRVSDERCAAREPRVPGRTLSLAALRVHAQGLLASFEAGHAGVVTDSYLATLRPDVSAEVLELCVAGVWDRTDGGYAVVSSEALRMAHEVHRQMRESRRQGM